jgi:hypothetical protein
MFYGRIWMSVYKFPTGLVLIHVKTSFSLHFSHFDFPFFLKHLHFDFIFISVFSALGWSL